MKERKIKIITILMTLAVCGLIYVQYYWITSAFKIEEEKFERNVKEVIANVINKIEINETASAVIESFEEEAGSILVLGNPNGEEGHEVITTKKIYTKKKPTRIKNRLDVKYTAWITDSTSKFEHKFIVDKSNVKTLKGDSNAFRLKVDTNTVQIKKEKIVDDVLKKLVLFNEKNNLTERINEKEIDSLLTIEFCERGINADYQFCITNNEDDSVKTIIGDENSKMLLASPYKARVFPHDLYLSEDYLYLYFPNKDSYILNKMITMLGLSVFFILTIIMVFLKTLHMFVKQKKISDLKNDLINNVTHEFKTPLATISLACEALNEPALITDRKAVTKYSGMISEENKRLSTLVENLLNTALQEKDGYEFEFEMLDVHEMLKLAADKQRHITEACNGIIKTEFSARYFNITGDEFHLFNVFSNLLDNANKYTRECPEILIKTVNQEKYLLVEIIDRGIGIEKQNLQKIFETFYRVPTGNLHDVKGNGIGLSYVKKIVEKHNGFVKVESRVNQGSTFKIYLPYEKK